MRRLVLAGGILVGLAAVGLLLAVANLQRIVDANQERIVGEMSAGFGRPVHVERIVVALRGGIGLRLERFGVADDPAFSKDDFLAADAVQVVVRVWPLLRGRVEVRRVIVEAPRITVVRTKSGLNLDTLGRRSEGGRPAPGSGAGAGGGPSPAIAVALLNIRGGVVRFVDRSGAVPVERTIAPLHLVLSDLSQTSAVRVELEATLEGEPPTRVRVTGHVGPVGEPPFAADVPIETRVVVRGPMIEIPDLTAAGSVRRDAGGPLLAAVRVRAAKLQARGVAFSALEVDASEREGVATLERLAIGLFGGTVEGHGHVDHRAGAPALDLQATARGLAVEEIFAAGGSQEAARVRGRLEGSGSLAATVGDEAGVRRTFTATGHVDVRDGVIRDVNLADGVLSGVTGTAGFVTLVPPRIRERYPEIFKTDDTRFERLSADVQVGAGRIHMNPVVVSARDYTLRGKGTATFEQHVDFIATLVASERLTKDIVGALEEATYLTDDAGRLAIPFRVVGTLPDVRPKLDNEFLGRVLRKALVGEGLGHLLGDDAKGDPKKPRATKKDLLRGLKGLFGR